MTVFQRPNALSILIVVALLTSGLAPAGAFKTAATATTIVLVAAWGWDELRYGFNWLRRSFGIGAMLLAVVALFLRLN